MCGGLLEYGGLADAEPQHAFPKHKPEPWKYTRRLIDAFPKHKVSELRKEFPTKQEFSWKSFHLQSSESSWTVYKRRLELHVLSREITQRSEHRGQGINQAARCQTRLALIRNYL